MLLSRLLRDVIDQDTPVAAKIRERMICAYIIGWAIGNDTFKNGFV